MVLVAGTRPGRGLLLADRLSDDQRRAVGWTLLLVGALTTNPLAFEGFGGRRHAASERREVPARSLRTRVPSAADAISTARRKHGVDDPLSDAFGLGVGCGSVIARQAKRGAMEQLARADHFTR